MKKRFPKAYTIGQTRFGLRYSYLVAVVLLSQLCLIGCKQSDREQTSTATEESKRGPDTIADPSEEIIENGSYRTTGQDGESDLEVCFTKSAYSLPYNHRIDQKKVTYETLPCEIEGVEEYLCDNRGLRYISLPEFNDVDVVLVPMDCGDFSYRYYLLTINNYKVVSNLYVEGEWYEPGSEEYKEFTSFTIDSDYKITSITYSVENGKTTLKEKSSHQLLADGRLKKI